VDTPVTIGPISLPPAVFAAIIAAIASIIGAGVSLGIAIWNTRKARDLETLINHFDQNLEAYKDTLTEKQAEKTARRE